MDINTAAPVITRDEILIDAPIKTIWEIQTHMAGWLGNRRSTAHRSTARSRSARPSAGKQRAWTSRRPSRRSARLAASSGAAPRRASPQCKGRGLLTRCRYQSVRPAPGHRAVALHRPACETEAQTRARFLPAHVTPAQARVSRRPRGPRVSQHASGKRRFLWRIGTGWPRVGTRATERASLTPSVEARSASWFGSTSPISFCCNACKRVSFSDGGSNRACHLT